MKKTITWVLLLIWLASPCMALCENVQVSAKAAVLYDTLTGTFLYDKAGDERLPMASTTKIMTALIALEQLPLEQEHVIRPEWTGIEGSSMYLKAGETLTTEELLCGLMLMSGNDAAYALACIVAGSEPRFVERMNEKAQALGLAGTSFESASGLDGENHYTTAKELAKLAANAMENEDFRRIVGQKYAKAGNRTMKNHNKLLFLDENICGVKTGFTKKSGRCLVSAAQQGGRLLIAVTLNDPDDWQDHGALYQSVFPQFAPQQVLCGGAVGEVALFSGEESRVPLYCAQDFTLSLSEAERQRIVIQVCGPRFACAPVKAGQPYGTLQVRLDDAVLLEAPVYYSRTVGTTLPPKGNFFTRLLQGLLG